ncbi:MAG: hypothetical protein JSS78_09500 [Bacteroidetes bacterium]|nr:hypothetical protein [Bacteroidota bacterium]
MNCRLKNKTWHVVLYNHSTELPSAWQSVLPIDHFLQPASLHIYELIQLPDISFLYALVYQNEKPVAAGYFQVLSLKKSLLSKSKSSSAIHGLWQAFSWLVRPKLLVGGHLFRHDICSFYAIKELAPFEIFQAYQIAIQFALKQCHAHAVLIKDVQQPIMVYFQHHAPEYFLLRNDISMEMKIAQSWHSLTDYEAALKHKYGQRFRKIRQSLNGATIKELSTDEVFRHQEVLYGLYLQVCERQPVRLGLINAAYLPTLKKANNNLHIWLVENDQKPIAFFSAWNQETVLDMFYIGFDYTLNDSLQLYFNLLFFGLEQAIRLGKKKLILGRTALEAKARIGCEPLYLSTYLFIKNSGLRWLVNQSWKHFSPSEEAWENRHPFKKIVE